MLQHLLQSKGLPTKEERDEVIRAIERERLKRYLGPLLKLLSGTSMEELWPQSPKALKWLNKKRNEVIHSGNQANRTEAYVALYTVIRSLVSLRNRGFLELVLDDQLIRYSLTRATNVALAEHDWCVSMTDLARGVDPGSWAAS